VPGQRPDPQPVAVLDDEVELGEVVDVDEPLGPGEPQLHHRQQAVPAGDERVAHAGGAGVVERCRDLHGRTP
jgi:hypothetical protein